MSEIKRDDIVSRFARVINWGSASKDDINRCVDNMI